MGIIPKTFFNTNEISELFSDMDFFLQCWYVMKDHMSGEFVSYEAFLSSSQSVVLLCHVYDDHHHKIIQKTSSFENAACPWRKLICHGAYIPRVHPSLVPLLPKRAPVHPELAPVLRRMRAYLKNQYHKLTKIFKNTGPSFIKFVF